MKKLNVKKLSLFLAFFGMSMAFMPHVSAQSEVYVFFPKKHYNSLIQIRVNDKLVYLNKDDIEEVTSGIMKGWLLFSPSKIKITLNEEEKVVFRIDMDYTPPVLDGKGDLVEKHYYAEAHLNLHKGSKHYLEFVWKGLDDVKIVELDQKQGEKEFKRKKYRELPEYIDK